jgi:hypothetical protein
VWETEAEGYLALRTIIFHWIKKYNSSTDRFEILNLNLEKLEISTPIDAVFCFRRK